MAEPISQAAPEVPVAGELIDAGKHAIFVDAAALLNQCRSRQDALEYVAGLVSILKGDDR